MAALPDEAQFASVLTLGELEKGIRKLAVGRRRRELERWLRALQTRLAGRTLQVDEAVALEWGRISAESEARGRPIPVVDALIGATATVHGLSVVTRNGSDIGATGASIVDPWEAD
jgi:predicted nucleic acid-binding protein